MSHTWLQPPCSWSAHWLGLFTYPTDLFSGPKLLTYLLGKNVRHLQASYYHNVNSEILLEGLFLISLIKCSPAAPPIKRGSMLALIEEGSLFLHCPLAGLLHWVLPSLAVVEARPCLVHCFVRCGQTCSRFNRDPLFNFMKAQYCFAPFKSTFLDI